VQYEDNDIEDNTELEMDRLVRTAKICTKHLQYKHDYRCHIYKNLESIRNNNECTTTYYHIDNNDTDGDDESNAAAEKQVIDSNVTIASLTSTKQNIMNNTDVNNNLNQSFPMSLVTQVPTATYSTTKNGKRTLSSKSFSCSQSTTTTIVAMSKNNCNVSKSIYNISEATEKMKHQSTDELKEESKTAKQNGLQSDRIAMQMYAKKYMLTVSELTMKKGFYNVPLLCNKDKADIELEYDINTERCIICVAPFHEGDNVAVNHGCGKPHCLHIACFYQYISTPSLRDKKDIVYPNLLMKLKGCPICDATYSPKWSQWKFSTIVTSNWKMGKKLPHNDKCIYGVHIYDDGEIKFSHFITDIELFNAIYAFINTVTVHQRAGSTGGTRTLSYTYHRYEIFNTTTFTCHECKAELYMWKSVYLQECKNQCEYRICRNCFIECVLSKNKYNECFKMRGILPCPLCRQSGQAHFELTREPCSHQYKHYLKI
jgi:hypothetical protein